MSNYVLSYFPCLCYFLFYDRKKFFARLSEAKENISYTKKAREILSYTTPLPGFRHIRLLHDNAPSHTSELVKQFLKYVGEGYRLATPTILSRFSLMGLFPFFSKTSKVLLWSSLQVPTSPRLSHQSVDQNKPSAQPSVCESEVQRTVTHLRNGFKNCNCDFKLRRIH